MCERWSSSRVCSLIEPSVVLVASAMTGTELRRRESWGSLPDGRGSAWGLGRGPVCRRAGKNCAGPGASGLQALTRATGRPEDTQECWGLGREVSLVEARRATRLKEMAKVQALHTHGPAGPTSPGNTVEMQNLGHAPDLLNQNLHFNQLPR